MSLSAEEWAKRKGPGGSIQRTCRERGRMVHRSCDARMIQNPKDPTGPWIPYVGPGTTLDLGRNKTKREKAS